MSGDNTSAGSAFLDVSRVTNEETRRHLASVVSALGSLYERKASLQEQIALEAAGVTEATPHWRKRNGEPKYLYLIHPQTNGQRVREYVGADPDKVQEALARVERYKERGRLLAELQQVELKLRQLEDGLRSLAWSAARQQSLWC